MLKSLTCETLHELDDGIAGDVINAELKKAIADLEDRGVEDEKPRSVTITVEMIKFKGLTLTNVKAEAKMPARRTASTHCEPQFKDGQTTIQFNNKNAERVDQPIFNAMERLDEEGGEVRND